MFNLEIHCIYQIYRCNKTPPCLLLLLRPQDVRLGHRNVTVGGEGWDEPGVNGEERESEKKGNSSPPLINCWLQQV